MISHFKYIVDIFYLPLPFSHTVCSFGQCLEVHEKNKKVIKRLEEKMVNQKDI